MLSRIEGLTVQEIAERTGRTPGSIKYQLTVGLRGLKAAFGDTESFHLPRKEFRFQEGPKHE